MTDKPPDLRNPFAPPREALIDRQIRAAQEAGEFDNLRHQGERLPLDDDSAAGEWALAYRVLRNANFAPSWIETDKDVRALLARRDAILERAPRASAIGHARARDELSQLVRDVNAAILRLNLEAPTARQQRVPLDLDGELAALDEAHRGA